jgi:hypothetical protein
LAAPYRRSPLRSAEHAIGALLVGAEPELAELVEELQTSPDTFDGLDLLSYTRHGGGGLLARNPPHHDPRKEDTAVSMSLSGLIEYVLLPVTFDDAHRRPSIPIRPRTVGSR